MTSETQWLDGQEMRIWRAFLEASGRLSTQLNDSLKANAGLTLDDYEVLVHISESDDGRLRMTELSRRLLHSQSRLTQRVDRLVNKGLVQREKCVEDGRGTFACITDIGVHAITNAAPTHVDDVRRLLIDLVRREERDVLLDVLERVATNARGGVDE